MSEMKVFENERFGSVRAFETCGEAWLVAKDVCAILGYANPSKAIADHVEAEDKLNNETLSSLGQRGGWLINESGLYSLVFGSKKPEAKAFKRWVTHEVLPAIRRRGVYIEDRAGETPEELMARALEEASRVLSRREERIKALEADNAAMRPKALFADAVSESGRTMLVGEFAKVLKQNGVDMGQNRLFEWLRANGYLMKSGSSYNLPTQRAMEMGLFRVKETVVTHADGHVSTSFTTKLTPKGQLYFTEKFLGRSKEAV